MGPSFTEDQFAVRQVSEHWEIQLDAPMVCAADLLKGEVGDGKPISRVVCPDCGRTLVERNRGQDVFVGCSGFPECGFIEG